MILDLLRKRASIRQFNGQEVPAGVIQDILEAGRLSPSGGNEQSWKFGLVTDKALMEHITEAAYNQQWMKKAGFFIVLCTELVDAQRGGRDVQRARSPKLAEVLSEMDDHLYGFLHMEEHQTKIPGTHMVLAALEHGVGSTWVSYFNVEQVAQLLHLPSKCIPSEILVFGYPVKEGTQAPKKSIEELVFYNVYQENRGR